VIEKSIKTILLIEDNPGDARLFCEMLKFEEKDSIHAELIHVECMKDAEEHLAQWPVNIILLDLGLPDVQGLEAVRRARAAAPHTPLVVLSGQNDESLALQTLQQGAQDYLIKGEFEPHDIFRALRYAVEREIIEERLFNEKERAQVTLNSIGDAVVGTGIDGSITFFNRAAGRMTGWSLADAVGRPVAEVFRILNAATHEVATSSTGRAAGHFDTRHLPMNRILVRRDGFETHIEDSASPILDQNGQVTGSVIVLRDVGALHESEEKYRTLIDAVQVYAIFMLDPDGQILSWNSGAERIKGYKAEEIIGQNFSRFFLPDDIKRHKPAEILRIAGELGKYEEHGIRVRKDNSKFMASVTVTAMRDPAGNLKGFCKICRDLAENKESEARYRGLLEAAPDGMVVVNQEGEIVLLNARAEKQFGYSRNALLGQKVTNIIPEGFAERLIADETRTAAEALAQQIGTGIELTGRRRDGSEFPIEIMLSPLESPEGVLVTAAVRDITVRKDAEMHLAQMEARYRGLMEAAPDGMVVVNRHGEIVLLNARAETQFGYRRDELLGQKVTNIIPEGFEERLIADSLRTTAEALAQQIGTGIELNGWRKDGSIFPIEIMLSPLESAEGILVTAAIRDISERKKLARQLHQSQKMEAIGQLTGGIAHDFNNLLGVIIGNLDLLDRLVADNESAVKRVRTAQKAATRGAEITRRLLLYSSNEDLMPSVVMLGDSIQNMIELATRGLGPSIKITTHTDESVPPLFVDPAGLESALLNLVVNARDAMPKGGSIMIGSRVQKVDSTHPAVRAGELKVGQYVCLRVTDTGQGMSKETLERAFEPFFTTKPRNKGTGLGLAMVYGFVKKSGGTVRVYSELGHGTTVSIYLPIVADLLRPVPAVIQKPLVAGSSGTVLVVDDEADLVEVALAYLAEMGLTALEAKDGASALEVLGQHGEIDLMVTDFVMPGGMNGAELALRARALRPGLKIIYSSGFPAEALAEKSMAVIDGPMLRKPYQRSEFESMVHRVMESSNGKLGELEHAASPQ
jgi:PAS domain S-box-containing protein